MLEILVIFQMCKDLRAGLRRRGYESAGWYQCMLIAMWILGETTGYVIGILILGNGFVVYVCALAGAIVGGVGAFHITNAVTPMKQMGVSGHFVGGFPVLPAKTIAKDEK